MKLTLRRFLAQLIPLFPSLLSAAINVGVGKVEITPPVGTPSAGYRERKGEGMEGTHDPLLAVALFIDNGTKQLALCSVDHLGFTYEIVQKITQKIHSHPQLSRCEIFIASSHTHSGGGAYLDIPLLGPNLAGAYDPAVAQFYIDRTCEAILAAYQNVVPAKMGIGYGKAENLSQYRSRWPQHLTALNDVTILKITHLDDTPLAVLFNYPVHPTILTSQNRLFSADFVGYARDELASLIGPSVQALYFNGAQGDILPVILDENDRFNACRLLAQSLAGAVKEIWESTETSDTLDIATQKESYTFTPQATPAGLQIPISTYATEMNLIVLNRLHAFITIPGELSCFYDKRLKEFGNELKFAQVSIFGLTNDAHGYIISPESWQRKTFESALSFGGEEYGAAVEGRAKSLLQSLSLNN